MDRWCATWRLPRGATLTPAQGWELARAWYGPDRRDPGWRRPPPAEAQAIFARVGLQGEFWRLD